MCSTIWWPGDLKPCYCLEPQNKIGVVRGSSCSQEGNIFCFASVLAIATVIGTRASSYAAQPCCNWVAGKYINLKSGKEVKPPKDAVAPLDEAVAQAKPKPAAPANPYYRLVATRTHTAATTTLCRAALQSGLHLRLRETGTLAITRPPFFPASGRALIFAAEFLDHRTPHV